MLKILLALMIPLHAAAEGWPAFDLNRGRARGRIVLADHIWVPPVPEPIVVDLPLEDTLPFERAPLFSPYKHGPVYVRGAVKVEVSGDSGKATLVFPEVTFGEPAPGDRAELFVMVSSSGGRPAAVSWATAICFGRHYLGYKAADFVLPDGSGDFSVRETFATGLPRDAIASSHPWLFAGGLRPGDLCSGKAAAALAGFRAAGLPGRAGAAGLGYDARKKTLTVTWKR
jgi:hypothetical protein